MTNEKIVVEGIEYKLYTNKIGPAVMATDLDSGLVFSVSNFATEAKAGKVYDDAVASATARATKKLARTEKMTAAIAELGVELS